MKQLSLLLLLILTTASSWAQQNTIKMSVVDESGAPLDYFNVIVINPSDSLDITGEVFYSGNFDYKNSLTGKKILKFISLGYKDYFLDIDFDKPVYPDKIVMQTDAINLNEVVVTEKRAAVKVEKGNTILQVSGSSLADLSDIAAIMRRAPGVKVEDDQLTVLGRGTPLIYIDGRKASYSELQLLLPTDILSIEIDRNPSSRYDASYSAVILVKTKKAAEGVSGRISAGVDIAHRTTPTAGGQLQINTPKLYTYVSLDFKMPRYKITDEYHQAILLPEYAMTDSTYTNTFLKCTIPKFLYNSVLTISPRSKLSWQYIFFNKKVDIDETVKERIEGVEIPLENIFSTKTRKGTTPGHKFNAGYRIDFDSLSKFEIFGDYSLMKTTREEKIEQLNTDTSDITNLNINNTNNSDVASIRSEYTKQIAKSTLLVGASYGFINSLSNTNYDGELYNTKIINNTVALYSTFGGEYEKWGYEVGLRYEYSGDKLLTNGTKIERIENKLFPSAKIHTTELVKNLDITFSYSARTYRPYLSLLNPIKSYINKVTIMQGNPNLLSTVFHNIALNLTMWKNLSLDIEYSIGLNKRMETGILSEDKKTVIFTSVNIPRATEFNLMLYYTKEWKFFSLSTGALMSAPNCRVPYMDGYYNNNRVSYILRISPGFIISKNTNISLDYRYLSRMSELMTVWEPQHDLSVDFSQYLFNRKLQIVVSAADLLNKSIAYRDKMGYYDSYGNGKRDNRRVQITLRYRFNNFQSKYKGYRASEESNRVN